nr:hypothetical protein [Dictyoglomus thermophilum]
MGRILEIYWTHEGRISTGNRIPDIKYIGYRIEDIRAKAFLDNVNKVAVKKEIAKRESKRENNESKNKSIREIIKGILKINME